ncbi:hypothetical protein J3T92_02690 [Bifidobacterium sp. B4081]|uniref:hypothetical protein n=1 Tax=unclassified Bifidobacterium TaxID=2608897 RepID=UPI00226A4B8E|nr:MULTISPECIES: hypothetical protein [unclassified Bifidobacterium]MCX8643336.1 hypothetical protein [Bifidobacterium sp. B4077]MCX8645518.1 hypothetical protein [Bifidobacterium sp. B4081]MCX8668771.1 hypothetical protein [Bifidobacterium sp. B3998]MCX8686980.1 hypothetical protein [Bifidobacterium sp. B4142]
MSAGYGEERLFITILSQKVKNYIRTKCQKIDTIKELCVSDKNLRTIKECRSENAGKSFKKLWMLLNGSLSDAYAVMTL